MKSGSIDFDSLRAALQAEEFFLLYQPIVSLSSGQCFGAEALVRWRRGEEVIGPSEFISLVNRTPLSGLLTYWVIDTVAADLGDWLKNHPEAHISINVPPEILGRGGLEYAARKSGLSAYVRQLVLEITERGIPDQIGLDALNSIAATGARVALDDTTLSGANLALLTRCHFDFIKIDQSLVGELVSYASRPQWLEGLKALLGVTPLQIIAEGVQSAFQVDALRAAGVQLGQGHFYSVPLDSQGLMEFYAASRRA